jgi:hypothetical protein
MLASVLSVNIEVAQRLTQIQRCTQQDDFHEHRLAQLANAVCRMGFDKMMLLACSAA